MFAGAIVQASNCCCLPVSAFCPVLLLQACLLLPCTPLQTYTDSTDNVWVRRGELHITALQSESGNSFTSGRIQTRDSWYPGMQVGRACLQSISVVLEGMPARLHAHRYQQLLSGLLF